MAITLNTVVYTFNGFLNRVVRYFNRGAGVPAGFKQLTASIDDPTANSLSYKVRWKLKLPVVVEGVSCDCPDGVARENFADLVVTVAKSSTTAERTDLALSLKDLTASPEFQASVISLLAPSA